MLTSKNRRVFIFTIVALLLAVSVGAYLFNAAREIPEKQATRNGEAALGVVPDTLSAGSKKLIASGEVSKPDSRLHRDVEVRIADPRRLEEFISSDNLAALVDELKEPAANNDGEAMALIARAQDECAYLRIFKNRGEQFKQMLAGKSGDEKRVALAHNDTEQRRCLELSKRKGGSRGDVAQLIKDAAANGDAYGLALQLEDDAAGDLESKILRLRKIVMSKNPEAIGVMAFSLGPSENSELGVRGPYAGSLVDVVAWQLVACRLGRDCGQTGALMRSMCLNQGMCLAMNYREYLRQMGATPRDFLEAETKEAEILHLIGTESYDLIFPFYG